MATDMQVNRYLEDKDMDRIDHALGRPVDPLIESYRNYYATERNGELAAQLRLDRNWTETPGPDRMTYFCVTQDGRRDLARHLRDIGDRHRLFTVRFDGITSSVVATSRAKAKYSKWLDISDMRPDLSFRDFLVDATVSVSP